MDEIVSTRKVVYEKLARGHRLAGRACFRWKYQILADLSMPDSEERARHRTIWIAVRVVRPDIEQYEEDCCNRP